MTTLTAIAFSSFWLRLGHYEHKWFGGWKSRVDNTAFFISPKGRENPLAELEATIVAMNSDNPALLEPAKQSAACAFPARYNFLREKGLVKEHLGPCPEFQTWSSNLHPESVSIVYSSAYANNPASMFGHTLMKLNQDSNNEILDYGVNFSALTDGNDPGLLYAFRGIFGLYGGAFSLEPYYVKINEYRYGESRDLWEYKIALEPSERKRLIHHLWELYVQAGFDYYFFDENCSFQLMALLQVVKPQWNLFANIHPWSFVLPTDTLKWLTEQTNQDSQLVVSLRPSLRRQVREAISALTSKQKSDLEKLSEPNLPLTSWESFHADTDTIDTAILKLEFLTHTKNASFTSEQNGRLKELLQLRATRGVVAAPDREGPSESKIVADQKQFRPDLSHGSSGVFGTFRLQGSTPEIQIGARASLHDLGNRSLGYEPYSEIEAFHGTLSFRPTQKWFGLEEMLWVRAQTFFPFDRLEHTFSWGLSAESHRVRGEGDCGTTGRCLEHAATAKGGIALELSKSVLAFGMGGAMLGIIPGWGKPGRYGPLLELGALWRPTQELTLFFELTSLLELNRPQDRLGTIETKGYVSWGIGQNWELRPTFSAELLPAPEFNGGLQLAFFF